MSKENRKDTRDGVWVKHPEFGMVKFSSPTPRQEEVLRFYGDIFSEVARIDHNKEVKDFLREKEKESS